MSTLAMPTAEHTVPAGVETDPDFSQYPARLPEFGTIGDDENTHGMALAYFQKIGRAARDGREDPVEQAVSNAKTYQWGQEFKPCDGEIISNEIMGCVLAITDLQTREPEPILIRPVQTRDKPQVFWIGPPVTPDVSAVTGLPPGLGMEPVIDPMTGQPALQPVMDPMGQAVGVEPMMQPASTYQPLDDLTAWQLKKLATAGAFPPEWMVAVDDRLVADVYQTIFDVMWKESHLDDFVYENVLKTNIYGYQGSYYSWDAQKKKHIVRDVSIKQLLLDPSAEGSSFELQRCPGFDVVMDIDQAKAEWPQLANVVDKYAKEGYPKRFDSNTDFGTATDRDFGRRTVTFRIYWFRDQLVPMLPQEAEAAGLVTLDTDPMTGEPFYRSTQVMEAPNAVQEQGSAGVYVRQQTGDGQAMAGGYAQGQEAAQEGQEEVGSQQNEQDQSQLQAQAPQGEFVTPPGNPPTGQTSPDGMGNSQGYQPNEQGDANSGLPESADHGIAATGSVAPHWPMTLAIRQMAGLAQAGRIVQDIRCEHWDIPMTLNVCIPLPSQPFGQGLPEKLKGMQEADIRLLTACVKYAETFSNPGSMVPQSVANALAKGLKRTHVDPKETLIIPDDLARQWGDKAILWFQPPPLPPAIANVMAMLQDRTQRTSGHSEVMQGNAPSPTSSGKLVEALQAGQTGMAMFQAQWTARMRERLANLMHYTHLWRLGVADIMQIYSRLPEQIMELVVERARRNKWDNHVDANAGGAAAKKLQQALALFSAVSSTGEPALPLRMLREAANIDPEEASIAYRQEVQNAMPQQPTAAPAPHDPSGANPNANQPVMA